MLSGKEALRVLVVDDDPEIVEFLRDALQAANCQVQTASDGDRALQQVTSFLPDVVFLDVVIPEQDGWLVCSKLKMREPAPAIVLVTGQTEGSTQRFADFVEADEFLRKPFSSDDVLAVLHDLTAVG